MKQKDWTKRLYDKLADYQEPAPADLWADIEARLAEKQAAPERHARVVPMWSKWVAVAAAFIGLLVGNAYLMWDTGHEEPTLGGLAQNKMTSVQKPTGGILPAAPIAVDDFVPSPSKSHKLMAQAVAPVEEMVHEEPLPIVESLPEEPQAVQPVMTTEEPVSKPQPKERPKAKTQLPSQEEQLRMLDQKIAEATRQKDSHMGLGLYAQSGFVNQLSTSGVMMKPSMAVNYVGENEQSSTTRAGNSDVLYYTNVKEQQKHYQPLSFGLTTNIPISSCFSLTTGLVYTRLASDFTNITGNSSLEREQTLHYLGIPLTAQFLIWKYKGLNVYVAGGGQVDYNFYARSSIEGVSSSIDRDRLQFSVQGALGLQYDIIPELGIYAEPGVKYYFDNGSDVRNFFKDTPTNFNLQLGLRLNLGHREKN